MSETFSPEDLLPVIGRLAAQYAAADLRLLEDWLDSARDRRTLLQCPKLTASLQFEGTVSEQRKLLLGLIRRDRSERVVRLTMDMTAETAFTAREQDVDRPLVVVAGVPPFLLPLREPETVMLRLVDGRPVSFLVRFGEDWDKTMAALPNGQHPTLENMDVELISIMLWTIASWPRSRPTVWRSLVAEPVRSPAAAEIARISWALADQVSATVAGGDAARLDAVRSRLAGIFDRRTLFHRLSRLEARLELTLEQDGDIAMDPFGKDVQRYDVSFKLDAGDVVNRLELAASVPDLLVTGPFHDMVLAKLGASPVADDLAEKVGRFAGAQVAKADIETFITGAVRARAVAIARIERKLAGDDQDLFIMKGLLGDRAAELIFTAELKLKRPEDEGDLPTLEKIHDFDIAGFRDGAIWHKAQGGGKFGHRKSLRYVHRILAMLLGWQALLG